MGAFCARTPERRPRLAADGASADGVRSQRRHTSVRAGGGFPPAANKNGSAPHAAPGERLCQRGTKAVRLRSRRERFVDGEQRRHTSGRTGRGLLSAGNKNGSAPHAAPGALCRWRTKAAAYLRPRREGAPAGGEQRRHTSCRAGGAPLPAGNKGGIPPSAPGERLCQRGTKTAARLMPRRGSAFASGEQRRCASDRAGSAL